MIIWEGRIWTSSILKREWWRVTILWCPEVLPAAINERRKQNEYRHGNPAPWKVIALQSESWIQHESSCHGPVQYELRATSRTPGTYEFALEPRTAVKNFMASELDENAGLSRRETGSTISMSSLEVYNGPSLPLIFERQIDW